MMNFQLAKVILVAKWGMGRQRWPLGIIRQKKMKARCQLLEAKRWGSGFWTSGPTLRALHSLRSGRSTFCFVSEGFFSFSFCFEALKNELLKIHISTIQFYVNIFNGVYMFSVKITPPRPAEAHIPQPRKNNIRSPDKGYL